MKLTSRALFACLCIAALSSCNHAGNKTTTMADSVVLADTSMLTQPQAEAFEATIDGRQTHLYILKNKNIQAAFTNYGARIVSLFVPDRTNKLVNVNLASTMLKAIRLLPNLILALPLAGLATALHEASSALTAKSIRCL